MLPNDHDDSPHPARPPRRRAAGEPRDPAPAEGRDASAAPPTPVAAKPEPARPTAEVSVGRLDLSDLEALAQMRPEDLAAMMEDAAPTRQLEPGSKVTGNVTRVGHDTVFVDVGGKSEGQLDRGELPNAAPGDAIVAFIVSAGEIGVSLTLKLTGDAAAEHLAEAAASGVPVEGRVESRNSGGYTVRVGPVRAFCPGSQISLRQGIDPDSFVGQEFTFKVLEAGERVVLSRRALQEAEAEVKAVALWQTLAEGQSHRGVVCGVQNFGFFVDIGGVDGLVPKTEITWGHTDDPREVVSIGQAVEVVVLSADPATRRLTLSAKALEDDPWSHVGTLFNEGGVYAGKVRNNAAFGTFVELAPGLEGLIHISKLAAGAPARDESIQVRLLQIDRERRRLALAPVVDGAEVGEDAVEAHLTGVVAEIMRNGVVVQLDDGRTGWLPDTEVQLPPGTVLSQRFRRGGRITARVARDDPKRVALSMKEDASAARRSWQAHQTTRTTAGFGTLGDLLGGLKVKK